ncbi:hypothetical protein GGR58DRAFT_506679 [Xylaria digitata]|nr:hypothetical protein GGR58DRAFT_506679 [Xylaria digitata]
MAMHMRMKVSRKPKAIRALDSQRVGGGRTDDDDEYKLGAGFSLFELRKNIALDLLNGQKGCHIRQGAGGKTHIRGRTELLDGGRVRAQPLTQRVCWTFDSLREELKQSLGQRALEVINRQLMEARMAIAERESELVPVGKRAMDIAIEEQMKAIIRNAEGAWVANPDYQVNQQRIDEAEADEPRMPFRLSR